MRTFGQRLGRTVVVTACGVASMGCSLRRSDPVPQGNSAIAQSQSAPKSADPAAAVSTQAGQWVFSAGFKNGWQDWGWAPHETAADGHVIFKLNNWGGWILAKPDNDATFGAVKFRVHPPQGPVDFLRIQLLAEGATFPGIDIGEAHVKASNDGWFDVNVSFDELNPSGIPFDRIVIQARRVLEPVPIGFDSIELVPPSPVQLNRGTDGPRVAVEVTVDCRASTTKVSPYIYGFAYNAFNDEKTQAAQWLLGGTIRRWGGNTTSTYNWEIGAWNTGNDWYFENHAISHAKVLAENAAHSVATSLTVPIMGWVSKDQTSSSFPVSVFGRQESTDNWRPEAGNGKDPSGKLLKPASPTRVYQPTTPEYVKRWVQAIRKEDASRGSRSVWMYILDNEPMIWSSTHRDVHPEPLSYDELVSRTIAYGTAVREADPEAIIAGPAEWGWTNYLYSAKDMDNGGPSVRIDRRAHGDLPVVAYYLKALAEHEKKTGTRVLNVLDLHGYPYADKVGTSDGSPQVAELRLRSTRGYWDPTYTDESWVREPVKLLPRMKEWVDTYYPGTGISIGEWSYGGETHMSGGLATAEGLGRFAQFGVTSAFYWTYPPANSPTMWAFRAYRDFDGKGGKFQDYYTPSQVLSKTSANVSVFASRDESGSRLVALVLNLSPKERAQATLDLSSCGTKVSSTSAYSYKGDPKGFVASPSAAKGVAITVDVMPYSINVLDIRLDAPTPVVRSTQKTLY